MIKPETIEKAQRTFAMLMALQSAMDDLATDGAFFRHKLKMTAKAFASELDKQIEDFYAAMSEEAVLYYNEEVKTFESLISAYLNNKVEAVEDEEEIGVGYPNEVIEQFAKDMAIKIDSDFMNNKIEVISNEIEK